MLWFLTLQSAHAVDLSTVVVAWEHTESGQAGNDDDDRAMDAALDGSGNVVVVGWLDGTISTGHDALALSFDPDGVERWRVVDDSSLAKPPAVDPDDRWYAVALDPDTGDTVLCGQAGAADRLSRYLVRLHTTDLASEAWAFAYDEGLASPTQSCRGVDFDDDHIATVGLSWGDDGIAGQWRGIAIQRGAQPIVQGLWAYDRFPDGDVPDEPTSVGIDLGGAWIVTGMEGRGGEVGGLTNDRDGAVQKRLRDGRELWGDSWRPDDPPTLDDRFLDAAVSPSTGNVLVVGWENLGTDNEGGSDFDGVAVLYDPVGYLGAPVYEWSPASTTWSGPGDQGMTAVTVDDAGNFYVAGFADAKGGGEQLVVVHMDATGSEITRWEGPAHVAVRPEAIVVDDEKVVLAGWVDDGNGPDVHVVALGVDSDGDGVADSNDGCPSDDDKVEPGVCGCQIPDDDADSDGVLDCEDDCAGDPDKVEPGVCGCNVSDGDSDDDGTADCNDECPVNPDKVEPGICGCEIADDDADADGYVTCRDQCPDSAPGAVVDAVGCEIDGETGDTGAEPKPPADSGGCGCSSPGNGAVGWLFLPLLTALQLRRQAG